MMTTNYKEWTNGRGVKIGCTKYRRQDSSIRQTTMNYAAHGVRPMTILRIEVNGKHGETVLVYVNRMTWIISLNT